MWGLLQKLGWLLRSWLILWAMLYLGRYIAQFIPLGVPASIWGLLLLFCALVLRLIPVEWVRFGSSLLIRFMALLFVPVSVGIIDYANLILNQWQVLLIPNMLSSMLGLICIALLADHLLTKQAFAYKQRRKTLSQLVGERKQ